MTQALTDHGDSADLASSPGEPEHSAHPMLKLAAPLVVIAATWATEKVLAAGYTAITGSKPPNADDRGVSFARALTWTIATAATAAVVQVIIYRTAAKTLPDAPSS
jgi:hypothetical protein